MDSLGFNLYNLLLTACGVKTKMDKNILLYLGSRVGILLLHCLVKSVLKKYAKASTFLHHY